MKISKELLVDEEQWMGLIRERNLFYKRIMIIEKKASIVYNNNKNEQHKKALIDIAEVCKKTLKGARKC